MPEAERGVKGLFWRERGSGPQLYVNAAAPSQYQPKGVREGRAAHATAKATDSARLGPERELDLPGVWAVARLSGVALFAGFVVTLFDGQWW